MVWTFIDSSLQELARIESDRRSFSSMRNQIHKLQRELKFVKMFIWCLATGNRANKDLKDRMDVAFRRTRSRLKTAAAKVLQGADSKDWDLLASELLEKVNQFKPTILATCLGLLDCTLPCESLHDCYDLFEFLEVILKNLNDLMSLKANMVDAMMQQIGILEEKLKLYRNFYDFAKKKLINYDEFKDLQSHGESWAYRAACLTLLYWVDSIEEELAPKMSLLLLDMVRNVKPGVLEVGMCLEVLEASTSSLPDINLVAEVGNGSNEILREGIIFLVSSLIDPPNLMSKEVDAILKQAASLICSYCLGGVKENIAKEDNVPFSDFLKKVKVIKKKLWQLHLQIPNSSLRGFPKTNGLGFMDFLLRNLEEKWKPIPFSKHQMLAVQEGLTFMVQNYKGILQLQNERSKTKDLQQRIIDVAYAAEQVIDSFSIDDSPFCYNMIRLSNVVEEIESLTNKVKKLKKKQVGAEMNFRQNVTVEAKSTSLAHEVFVGFKDEEEELVNRLTSGSLERDIVSIVGMPGLGKTFLAKKVYNSSIVQCQFQKRAWCSVSQFYKRRELFSAILKDVDSSCDDIQMKSDEDLEHLVYKSLKGQRYLIVMDDIWDTDAWEELKQSFPNDRNKSRIIFTSRIQNVAPQANSSSSPHFLRPFSDEECWELLRKKLFHTDNCPPNLSVIGKQIARKCRGLPLAVVVIAGVLAKAIEDLSWWIQIERSLGSHIASSSFMDILELSYNHLPDFLKPCFLYLAAFQEDQVIDAKTLTFLWIAEGFIINPGSKSLDEVAQEYLMDLIRRNLVIVSSKNSTGRIKECSMHDLIHEVCLKKAKEENFMELVYNDIKARYESYRISILANPESFIHLSARNAYCRSLLFSCAGRCSHVSHTIKLFNNFKFLKVLHLGFNCVWESESLPIELTSLVLLRYLAVHGYFESIPPSIANLKNLETFRLRNHYGLEIELPNTIWKMRSLRHVDVVLPSISSSGDMPEDTNQLDNIESFGTLILSQEVDAKKLLRRIPRVRKLRLLIYQSWSYEFSMLDSLSKLEYLSLHYDENPPQLYPCAISFPLGLRKLILSGLGLPWMEISAIEKLPNLKILKLRDDAFVGDMWNVEDGEFLKLKCLKMQNLDIKHWNASSDSFLCLEQLFVVECSHLDEIPSSFGIISTLKMIQVLWCNDKATSSAREIVEVQQELGNEDLEVDIRI